MLKIRIIQAMKMKDGLNTSGLKALVCRMSTFKDTSQSFAHLLIYKIISSVEGAYADIAYLPDFLPSYSKMKISDFDVIAVSVSLVQELLNFPAFFSSTGINACHDLRIEDEEQPLIVAGGSNSGNCHFLLHKGSPVDIIYTGSDPDAIKHFFERIRDLKASGHSKVSICRELMNEFSVVHPVLGESGIKEARSPEYFMNIQPAGVPLIEKEDPNSSNLVISAGCPWFCSFCNESYRSKPYSEAGLGEIEEAALKIKRENGSDEVGLFSFNFNAHSGIEEIIALLHRYFRVVSLMSQRFDILAGRNEFLKLMQQAGKTAVTCGLEGISARIRRYLSKDLGDDELYSSLEALLDSPLRTLKIFLIGAGIETEEDYEEFAEIVSFISGRAGRKPRPPRIIFSLTPLVRFPGTPQGRLKAFPAPVMQGVADRISGIVRSAGFEFRMAGSVYEYYVSQVLLRNSSNEFYSAVMKAVKDSGFVYYDKVTGRFYEKLRNELSLLVPDPDSFLNNNIEYSHLNTNISAGFLNRAAEKISRAEDIPTCRRIKKSAAQCCACGACSTPEKKASTSEYHKGRSVSAGELKAIQAEYNSGREVLLPVILTEKCEGLSDKYIGAVLSSALYKSVPGGERFIKRLLRLDNRTRFGNERLTGCDTAVFLCSAEKADELKKYIGTATYKAEFEKHARGIGYFRESVEQNRLEIKIGGLSKIDTSFISSFHVRSTVVKIGEGTYEAVVSKDGLKRKQFTKIVADVINSRIEVYAGEKFDLNAFLKVLRDRYKLKHSDISVSLL